MTLRQTMDAALKDQVAEKEMKEKKQAAAPTEFAPAALAKMTRPRCASCWTRGAAHQRQD